MFNPLVRWVSIAEFQSTEKVWQTELLQCVFQRDTYPMSKQLFAVWVTAQKKQFRKHPLTEESLNERLQLKLQDLKSLYPSEFPEGCFGYYSQRQLYKLWEQGKVTIDNYTLQDLQKEEEEVQLRRLRDAEIERARQEQLDKEEKEAEARRDALRTPVVVGMSFKAWYEVELAYREMVEKMLGDRKPNAARRKRAIEGMVVFHPYNSKDRWVVKKIVMEGGRKWAE